MKEQDSCVLKVNGEEILVWTDGKVLRAMSERIVFTEVPLIDDKNYGEDKHPIFEEYFKKVKKVRKAVFGVPM